ncbi:hypothetical protein lerEdw1_013821 [Lerista edwardsae]|nr:hypothetical protein lerEdw1_013821 [Lerista edwardsae]
MVLFVPFVNSMQDNTSESSTSITQLLRESYLAENNHQGNSERSRSEPSPHSFHCGSSPGTSDEVSGQDDLDLSAFLSQEELDESVNLARQAINQDPLENKPDEQQIHVFFPSELKTCGNTVANKHFQSTAPTSDNSVKKQQFGTEAESKKEFLNKAADFIEELSSLFKAHNSKRIRPRTCKNRSKLDSKNKATQDSSLGFTTLSESRERPCVPVPQDIEQIETEHSLENPDNPQQADSEVEHKFKSSELTTESSAASFDSEEPIGQRPHFSQKLKSREVPEGTKVQLDCIVVGIPAPEVRWYCEGKELENSPDIHIIQSDNQHSLIILEAFEEDTGRYSCFASNIYGTDSTSAEIYVEGASSSESEADTSKEEMDQYRRPTKISSNMPPPPVNATPTYQEAPKSQPSVVLPSQSPTNYLQGLDGRPIIAAPVFTKMLQEISASEGQLVVFECRVKGAPSPKVEWYREGTLIEDSPDFRILQKNPTQLKQLHNQVMLEQQQVQQPFSPPPREQPFSLGSTGPNQQPSSTVHKQNKGSMTQTFTYTRPKQFLASQNTTPTVSSPSSSPMPSFSSAPQGTQRTTNKEKVLGPPPPVQTRSPGGFTNQVEQALSSPKEPVLPPLLLSVSSMNQFQPQSVPPTPLSPTGRIQNPVAFLSSVLPSLPSTPPTNAMGLPKSAPAAGNQGAMKKNLKPLQLATEDSIRDHRAAVVKDLEKRLHLREDVFSHGQQRTTYDENLARKLQGPSNDTPIFNFTAQDVSKEYKISSFEQRLMNEIEFRLERTPVDESDDEIEHDEIPTGKCIAPIFDKRLKHFRVLEGYPATFTCKIVGIPIPKVYWFKDGKQISKKNEHYRMSREGDGTCALHIEETTNDDDGNYTFMAANPQGRISCSGHLMVQTPPLRGRLTTAIQPHRGRSRISEREKEPMQERFFRPYFLQAPGDMVAHEGRLCRLDCKPMRGRADTIWYLESNPTEGQGQDGKRRNSEEGRRQRDNVKGDPERQRRKSKGLGGLKEEGKGVEKMRREGSRDQNETRMRPLEGPRKEDGRVKKIQGRRKEGWKDLERKQVSGLPPPDLMWLLNGKPVLPDTTHKMLVRETGVHSLLIDPLTQNDAGIYTCLATNKTGQNSFSLELSVVEREVKKAPVILEKLQNCGVPEGHPVRLECRVI